LITSLVRGSGCQLRLWLSKDRNDVSLVIERSATRKPSTLRTTVVCLIGEDRKSFEQQNNYSSPSAGNLEIRGAKAWEDAGNCAAKKYGEEPNEKLDSKT
jgi:hypothetical protein